MTDQRKIQIWLYVVCFMIFAMAIIGAITRLTESGLSITEWRPVTGALPPLSEAEWQRVYDLYRQSPEFRHKHFWMEIEDFRKIYFWEWLHRLWGRLIGLVFALPLLYFWMAKKIPAGHGWKLLGLFLLGGLQGALGWWMVKSGLIDRPDVSHYRLAAHLSLALVLFGLTWWVALDLGRMPGRAEIEGRRGLLAHGWGVFALLALTIIWGAFTAGLDAGHIYNSWPLMNGSFTPPEAFGGVTGFFGQHGWVQFVHRWLAFVTGLGILAFALRLKNAALAAMVFIQIGLGIATLLSQVALPLAALHQAGAIILLALCLQALHGLAVREDKS